MAKRYAWMRILRVTLTSSVMKKKLVFGNNEGDPYSDVLDITVTGYKYMSALKDNFVVEISNLPYLQFLEIITGEFFNVKIEAGYQNCGIMTIFEGGLIYISQKLGDHKTNTAVLVCGSSIVAANASKKINLSLNSGINMYSAFKYISTKAGVNNLNVSDEFKLKILTEGYSGNGSAASLVQLLCDGTSYGVNSDSSLSSDLTIWDYSRTTLRKIPLNENNLIMTNGYPQLTKDGVTFTCLPTFDFQCGDTVVIDNSLLDISVSDYDTALSSNLGYYLDENGEYMVYQIEYNLCTRSDEFTIQLYARNTSLLSSLVSSTTT